MGSGEATLGQRQSKVVPPVSIHVTSLEEAALHHYWKRPLRQTHRWVYNVRRARAHLGSHPPSRLAQLKPKAQAQDCPRACWQEPSQDQAGGRRQLSTVSGKGANSAVQSACA